MDCWVLKLVNNFNWVVFSPAAWASFVFHSDPLYCGQLTCGICFENFPWAKIEMASCGHPFCISCWEGMSCVLLLSSLM